jgi:hypothetical protein
MAVGEVWRVRAADNPLRGRLVAILQVGPGPVVLVAPEEGGDLLWVLAEELEPRRSEARG